MGNLDDCPVEPDEFPERDEVTQWRCYPAKKIGRWDVREQSVRLDHGNGVDSKEELMLFVGVLDDCHERIGQDSDENCHNEEVTEEEEANQDGFAQEVVLWPKIPGSGSEAHGQLESGYVRECGYVVDDQLTVRRQPWRPLPFLH
jgi:hypothetical protein